MHKYEKNFKINHKNIKKIRNVRKSFAREHTKYIWKIDENPVDSLHNNGFIFNEVNLENDENPSESYKFNYRFNFFQILNEIWNLAVLMCSSYLVENFFLVILRLRFFFIHRYYSQVVCDPVLAKPYKVLEGWFFGQLKLSVYGFARTGSHTTCKITKNWP